VILDPAATGGRDPEGLAGDLLAAGVRWLQLRHKRAGAGELLAVARRLAPRVRAAGGILVVNDRPDVARLAGAGAVHLGQDDVPVGAARAIAPELVVGVSTHGLVQARRAAAAGADYVAVGAIYPTGSKAAFELVGLETLRQVRREVATPLVAIGGITLERVPELLAAGADGIAVISAVSGAPDPVRAAAGFLAAIRRWRLDTPARRGR
jgi:thiamine-phosphate diphosphorylase